MALGFDPKLPPGKSTPITYAEIFMKVKVASFSEDRWVLLIFTAKHPDFLRNNLIAKVGEPTKPSHRRRSGQDASALCGEIIALMGQRRVLDSPGRIR